MKSLKDPEDNLELIVAWRIRAERPERSLPASVCAGFDLLNLLLLLLDVAGLSHRRRVRRVIGCVCGGRRHRTTNPAQRQKVQTKTKLPGNNPPILPATFHESERRTRCSVWIRATRGSIRIEQQLNSDVSILELSRDEWRWKSNSFWDNFPKNLSTKPRYCIGFSVVFMT